MDILVNNADHETILTVRGEVLERTFAVNTRAPLQMMQRFVPLMLQQGYGRVVNLASETASFSLMSRPTGPPIALPRLDSSQ